MSTRADSLGHFSFLNVVTNLVKDTEFEFLFQGKVRTALAATSVSDTLNVPEDAMRSYQSIIPLKGVFANDPSWDDLPTFLENYWREIDETVETD